jgi:glycosyltransferase involved in cell wall biosynthesis
VARVKVLVAHNRYRSGVPSGENAVVDADIEQLRAAGVTVLPFLCESDSIESLPVARRALLPLSPIYARTTQRELARLLATHRPDLVHLHNPYPLISPWIVRTAHRYRVPVVQTVHNYRHVCAAATFFRDGRPCHDCQGRLVPLPAVVHSCYRGSRAQSVVMATTLTVHRPTWRQVDRYLTLTPSMGVFLQAMGVDQARIAVKPNTVPDPGEHNQVGSGFLFAGRLVEEKGVRLLLSAWREATAAAGGPGSIGTLTVAGDGPLRGEVEAAAGLRTDVRYVGRLDRAQMGEARRAAAVLVLPSLWEEPFPLTVVEALADARPALVTAMGGLPDIIGATGEPPTGAGPSGAAGGTQAQPAGWAVPPCADALCDALVTAHRDAGRYTTVARRRYLENFSPPAVTARLLEIYDEVLAEAGNAASRRTG